jgi:glycosidase
LGVNTLWLTPIFPSPSHHGYDATDLFEIEPRLGTKADLRLLIQGANAHGIRILLDFVPNHWSNLHNTFQNAIKDSVNPYRDWYTFKKWPDQYESFFGVKELPQVNLRFPAARQHMLDAAKFWLDFGVDGYRVDYALGPSPDFWAEFRRVITTTQLDAWTFGEVVEPSDTQLTFEGGLDGCLDFMMLEGLRQTFAYNRWSGAQFGDFIRRHEAFFPITFSRPTFLDNHDMNRYLWAAGGDQRRLRLAALCQFSLSGQPIIYYGTEVGLSQERDTRYPDGRGVPEEARLPMLWGEAQDVNLLAFYKQLIALRKKDGSLRKPTHRILLAGEDTLVYTADQESPGVVTALNLSDQPRHINLPGDYREVVLPTETNCEVKFTAGQAQIDLPALSGLYLI